jgi:hypothetical protein
MPGAAMRTSPPKGTPPVHQEFPGHPVQIINTVREPVPVMLVKGNDPLERLTIDLDSNSVTLDGTSFNGLDPLAVRILQALKEAQGLYLSSRWIGTNISGCNGGEKGVRRHLGTLPEQLQAIIVATSGAGRRLQLPPPNK